MTRTWVPSTCLTASTPSASRTHCRRLPARAQLGTPPPAYGSPWPPPSVSSGCSAGSAGRARPPGPPPRRAWGQNTGGAKVFSEPVGPQVPGDLRGPPVKLHLPGRPVHHGCRPCPVRLGYFPSFSGVSPTPRMDGALWERRMNLSVKRFPTAAPVLKARPALCFLERGHLGTQEGLVGGTCRHDMVLPLCPPKSCVQALAPGACACAVCRN